MAPNRETIGPRKRATSGLPAALLLLRCMSPFMWHVCDMATDTENVSLSGVDLKSSAHPQNDAFVCTWRRDAALRNMAAIADIGGPIRLLLLLGAGLVFRLHPDQPFEPSAAATVAA
jgi:hypothetical protein